MESRAGASVGGSDRRKAVERSGRSRKAGVVCVPRDAVFGSLAQACGLTIRLSAGDR